ncbi:RN114 ligase, partial [Polypterus senegalus]
MDAFDFEPGNAEEFECPICRDVLFDPVSLPCKHVSIQTRNHCPTCRGQDTTTVQANDVIARMTYKTATCKTCGVQVCPICASMPYGDPSYQSRNFLGHLNLRHSFYVQDFMVGNINL